MYSINYSINAWKYAKKATSEKSPILFKCWVWEIDMIVNPQTRWPKILNWNRFCRMKSILQEIIGENQSVFVAERLITDNVLVAHEMMNHISKKRKGKCGEMAVKLDMSKAYNRVEWDCLQLIMQKLGFHERWISIVMCCVSSVKCAVRINGQPCGRILPTRGLRQGDPLSPYLFLFCAEGLSALLHQASQRKAIKGVAASTRGPRVSHLFFADNSLVFWKSNTERSQRNPTATQSIWTLLRPTIKQQQNFLVLQPQHWQCNKRESKDHVWCSSDQAPWSLPWATISGGKVKKEYLWSTQTESSQQSLWLEGKAINACWEGNFDKGGGSSRALIHDEFFFAA